MDNLSKEVLYDLYIVKNMTENQIANMYNCQTSKISRLKNQYGIKTRSPYQQPLVSKEQLMECLKQNMSPKEISRKYNCGKTTVINYISQYGLK
jgi:transposase